MAPTWAGPRESLRVWLGGIRRKSVAVALRTAASMLSSCQKSGSGTPVAQPTGFVTTSTFSTSLSDDRHLAPASGGGHCTPGSNVDLARTIAGTATATLGDIDPTTTLASGVRDIGVTVPDGVYTWSNRALNFDWFPTGITAGPFIAKFSFTYRAEVDQENQPDVCVFRSVAVFSGFTVTGIAALDCAILEQVKNQAQSSIDRTVADRISRFVRGVPFPAGTEPRCDNWSQLP